MNELPVLEPEEQRILGSLLEKQTTVPGSYPLTANALRSACNQTSNREPVTDLDQQTVERTARSLKERGLLRIVWSDTGRRTLKYHQILDERLGLEPDERALLTVLLLRGAQAPGELRTRTERLQAFGDRGAVEACLRRMAERPQPLVHELERQPGQQDRRWVHLLGPSPQQQGAVAAPPAVDRDAVIADGAALRDARVRSSYDAIAATYAEHLVDELAELPRRCVSGARIRGSPFASRSAVATTRRILTWCSPPPYPRGAPSSAMPSTSTRAPAASLPPCAAHPLSVTEVGGGADAPRALFEATGAVCNLPALNAAAEASGFLNAAPDCDGVLRRVPMGAPRGRVYPSLALAAVHRATGGGTVVMQSTHAHATTVDLRPAAPGATPRQVALDGAGNMLVRYRGRRYVRDIAIDVLAGRIDAAALHERLVFVGTTALGTREVAAMLLDTLFVGVEVQATAADNPSTVTSSAEPRARPDAGEPAGALSCRCLTTALVVRHRYLFGLWSAAAARWPSSRRPWWAPVLARDEPVPVARACRCFHLRSAIAASSRHDDRLRATTRRTPPRRPRRRRGDSTAHRLVAKSLLEAERRSAMRRLAITRAVSQLSTPSSSLRIWRQHPDFKSFARSATRVALLSTLSTPARHRQGRSYSRSLRYRRSRAR